MLLPLEKNIKVIENAFKDDQGVDDMFYMVNGMV